MLVLGIDPGSTLIGYGFVTEEDGQLKTENYGLISIEAQNQIEKLSELRNKLNKVLEKSKPNLAGVEKIFFSKNHKTAIEVAQARGVILQVLNEQNIKILELSPPEIKMAVAGQGNADKKTVAKMVSLMLNLETPVKEDNTADALAIAIATQCQSRSVGI